MCTILIYQCPVDHHGLNDWAAWNEKITSCLLGYHHERFGFDPPFKINSKEHSLFYYGRKHALSVAELAKETTSKPGMVKIRQWSTIVFYSAVAIIVGSGIDIDEVRRCLSHLTLLNEYPIGFAIEKIRLVLYRNVPQHLLNWQKAKHGELVYIANRPWEEFNRNWLLPEHWSVLRETQDNIVVVNPKEGCPVDDIWHYHMDHAFIAIDQASIFIDDIISSFDQCDDLALYLNKFKINEPVIAFNRNQVDDCFICAYNLPFPEMLNCSVAVF